MRLATAAEFALALGVSQLAAMTAMGMQAHGCTVS